MTFSLSRLSFGYVALQILAVLLLFWCVSKGEVMSAFLVLVTSMVVMFATVKNIVLPKRCYLSGLMFLLVSSSVFLPSIRQSVAGLSFALSIWYLCRSFRHSLELGSVFKMGFFLSLASVFAFESVFMLPCMIIGLKIFKRTPREVVLGILGFILPLFAVCYVNWGFLGLSFTHFFVEGFKSVGWGSCQCSTIYANSYWGLAFLILVGINLILALLHGYLGRKQARRRSGKFTFFFFLLTLFMFAIFFFSSSRTIYILMAVPISVLLPLFFLRSKGWFAKFMYFSLIALGLLVHIA